MMTYDPGDVVLVRFPQSGTTQRKQRPGLVVLDIGDADVVLAPITTRSRSAPGDCQLADWTLAGLLKESWVRLAKVACLQKTDIVRPLGRVSDSDMQAIVQAWHGLYTLS